MESCIEFVGDWLPKHSLPECGSECAIVRIGNLECVFSDRVVVSGKAYTCVLPNQCMDNVASGDFLALSVANNHVNDAANFAETLGALHRRFPDIQFFGSIDKPYAEFRTSCRCVVVIGCLEPCRSRGARIFKQEDVASLIQKLRQPDNQAIKQSIYVYPHWGMEGEYTRYPSPKQQVLAKTWIDAGADGVFGSHSHVPQGREWYKGKPIYYSLGNFDFDHPESKLYEGTTDRLVVEINDQGEVTERFSTPSAKAAVVSASQELVNWNTWRWAKKVGPFNIRKNMASWKIRLSRNFIKTMPKFIVWQFLPKTILFRVAMLLTK